jgi:predicted nucleotidyltransferase
MSMLAQIGHAAVDLDAVRSFAERHRLAELSLFGSVLRDDFDSTSDLDVLFELLPGEEMTIERYLEMQAQLEDLFGRRVDVVRKSLLTNPFRRHEILTTRQRLYVVPAA